MKILISGDSYTFGIGCLDLPSTGEYSKNPNTRPSEYCWASLLGRDKSSPEVHNCARPGSDNLTITESIWNNIHKDIDIVMFCGSFINRVQVKDPLYTQKTARMSLIPSFDRSDFDKKFIQLIEDYYKYFYCDETGTSYTISSILSSYAVATLNGAKFLWSVPTRGWLNDSPVLDMLKEFQFKSTADFSDDNEFDYSIKSPCGHLSDLGHRRYYQSVIAPFIGKHF